MGMARSHKVLMSGQAVKARSGFYQAMTPSQFSLLWIEDLGDPDAAAEALRDVAFWYGAAPSAAWLERMPNLKVLKSYAEIEAKSDRQLDLE